jgi:hypothetical protein
MDVRGVRRFDAVWLFPPTYVIHLTEEYLAAGGFPLWAERTLAIRFSDAEFTAWSMLALGLTCLGAWLVSCDTKFRFIEIALAIAVLGNVATHVFTSLLTWTYSPGLVSGVLIWIPLGALRLRSAQRASTRRGYIAGVYLGLAVVLITMAVVAVGASASQISVSMATSTDTAPGLQLHRFQSTSRFFSGWTRGTKGNVDPLRQDEPYPGSLATLHDDSFLARRRSRLPCGRQG